LQNPGARRTERGVKAFSLLVDRQENFLRDIFRVRTVSYDFVGQVEERTMKAEIQKIETIFAPVGNIMKQRFIAQEPYMVVRAHLARDYRDWSRAPQAGLARIFFEEGDTKEPFQGIRNRCHCTAVTSSPEHIVRLEE
jgi:hypothetical protein